VSDVGVREQVVALSWGDVLVLCWDLGEGDDVVPMVEVELVPLSVEVLVDLGEYRG